MQKVFAALIGKSWSHPGFKGRVRTGEREVLSTEELGSSSLTCPLLMKEIEGAHKHPAQKTGYKLVFWHVMPQHSAAASRPGWRSMCGLLHVAGKSPFSVSSCREAVGRGAEPGSPRALAASEPRDGGTLCGSQFPHWKLKQAFPSSQRTQRDKSRVRSSPAQQWESGEKCKPIAVGPWSVIQQPVLCTSGPPVPPSPEGTAGISPRARTALLPLVLSLTAGRGKSLDYRPPSCPARLFPRLTPADQHRPFWPGSCLHFVLYPLGRRTLHTKELPGAVG